MKKNRVVFRWLFRWMSGALLLSLLTFWFCGVGKANSMLFLALKREPGFNDSLFIRQADSAFGVIRLDDELKARYSYILFSFSLRYGTDVLRRT